MKKCTSSPIIREMQFKTTISYHHTTVRTSTVNKIRGNNCWHGHKERGRLRHHWWQSKLVQQLQKTVWQSLKNLKIELPHDPAFPLPDVYMKEVKILTQKDICTTIYTAALFTVTKIWKHPKCPLMGKYTKKTWYINIMDYYSATDKNEILQWRELEGGK